MLFLFKHDYNNEASQLSPFIEMKEKLLKHLFNYAWDNYLYFIAKCYHLHDNVIASAGHLCEVSRYFLVYKLRRAINENWYELYETFVSDIQAMYKAVSYYDTVVILILVLIMGFASFLLFSTMNYFLYTTSLLDWLCSK